MRQCQYRSQYDSKILIQLTIQQENKLKTDLKPAAHTCFPFELLVGVIELESCYHIGLLPYMLLQ